MESGGFVLYQSSFSAGASRPTNQPSMTPPTSRTPGSPESRTALSLFLFNSSQNLGSILVSTFLALPISRLAPHTYHAPIEFWTRPQENSPSDTAPECPPLVGFWMAPAPEDRATTPISRRYGGKLASKRRMASRSNGEGSPPPPSSGHQPMLFQPCVHIRLVEPNLSSNPYPTQFAGVLVHEALRNAQGHLATVETDISRIPGFNIQRPPQ